MKHLSWIMLVLLLASVLSGCTRADNPKTPLKFYYPNLDISYGTENAFLAHEIREGEGKTISDSIGEFLRGPKDSAFENPFPKGTKLLHFEQTERSVQIVVSDDYAAMTGLDLSIANACLTLTVLELADADSLTLRCETAVIDGQQSISLTRDSILLFDSSKSTIATEHNTTTTP